MTHGGSCQNGLAWPPLAKGHAMTHEPPALSHDDDPFYCFFSNE